MKNLIKTGVAALLLASSTTSCDTTQDPQSLVADQPKTFCNPVDLSYRFMVERSSSRREAADPTVVLHKGTYYIFASKTGGYWYSDDLANWELVVNNDIPTEDYAPTAISLRDTIFFTASCGGTDRNKVYKSSDPKSGVWEEQTIQMDITAWDPCFFQDDDERLYFYWGCSNYNPMYGVEIDPYTFEFIGEAKELITSDHPNRGWEAAGDYNTLKHLAPWIEGAWMNKHNGKYYYQYAAADAAYKSYCDAVMVSDSPLGEYTLAPHNAFAYKPEGFVGGIGHGSTFEDKFGNLWHMGSVSVAVKHRFERRLAMCPAFFDENDNLYTYTRFGDYPTKTPQKRVTKPEDYECGWMLLSYGKDVEVSSQLDGFPAENMVNEDVRTYWSAASGGADEWAIVDLGEVCDVNALQINFAEQDTNIFGREEGITHKYIIETSTDGERWQILKDESASTTDNTHNYIELTQPLKSRYIKVKNVEVPGGKFAISGLRVFGLGVGDAPAAVEKFVVTRDAEDRRDVTLEWQDVEGATGYNIAYGISEDMIYHNYMVYGVNNLTIRTLDTNQPYHFTIEPFNECGVGARHELIEAK